MMTKEQQLHKNIRENNKEDAEKLLNRGTSINCVYYGMTPLLVAISQGKNYEIMHLY